MKCLQKLFSSPLRLVAFSLLLSITFSTVLIKNNTYAVSDISVTYNSGFVTSAWTDIFSTCTGSCLHDYSYLVVESSSNIFSNENVNDLSAFRLYARMDGSLNRTLYFSQKIPIQVYNLSFNDSSNNYLQWGNGTNLAYDLTFILTNNPLSGPTPSGSITLTENGTFDVSSYAEAVVDVPMEVVPGDYHDDLQDVKKSIILVPAVCLVIYFFYAIYKMIMGGVRR